MVAIPALAPSPELSSRVLVVDDHEMIRRLLTRHLADAGYEVLSASSGMEALHLLHTSACALVILDMMMPHMSGIEVLHAIKSDRTLSDVSVLMLSAEADTEHVITCLNKGAEDYLTKPFNAVLLKARVHNCVERYRLRLQERRYREMLEQQVAERSALAQRRAEALDRSEEALREQMAILQSILTSMGDGVIVVDSSGRLVLQNPASEAILGSFAAAMLPGPGTDYTAIRTADGQSALAPENLPLAAALNGQRIASMELCLAGSESSYRWINVAAGPICNQHGLLTGAFAVVRDVTALKQAELAIRESEIRYALAAQGANDGLWDWHFSSHQLYLSPRWKAMLGYADHEVGAAVEEWFGRVHPEDRDLLETRIAAHCRHLISHFQHEYRMLHRDGTYRWMLCRGLAVWNANDVAVRMAGSQSDITHRKQVEQQLLHDALHDGLTGLPNRVFLIERLSTALERLRRDAMHRFAVLFLDLDRFKIINDSLGHVAGDQLLMGVADQLRTLIRTGDTVARLGGDEFIMLLENITDETTVHQVAKRIQDQLSSPWQLNGQEVTTSVSVGIVLGHTGYASANDIIRDADTAMYRAKMSGKARSVVFSPDMHMHVLSQLQLEVDLRSAIERNELRVHYQPIITLASGEISGFEALVRWQHPHKGLLLPTGFLPVAEETGLIEALSWWVLERACAEMTDWHRRYPRTTPLWMSVNMSIKQLSQPDIITRLEHVLAQTGIAPACLKLEITEHTIMEHREDMDAVLARIHELGIQLCIDDFGTGYSSLSLLQQLPADLLKIDRSFIQQLDGHGQRAEIVQTIVELARTLGMQVVAEGTETVHQLHELRRLDCAYGQGWLFAHAQDAETIDALLASNHQFMIA